MNIYFTSDTHYGHRNIVRSITQWDRRLEKCRNFASLEEHDARIVDNINSVVRENDILYHLGDWSFGGINMVYEFRKRLKCKTIHLIGGNHDDHIRDNKLVRVDDGYANLQYLFNSYNELLHKKIGGQRVSLCHYSMRTWPKAARGAWNLYGHSHGDLPNNEFKSMDVGIDTHPEFRPYHLNEIKTIMDDRIDLIRHQ